MRYNMKISKLLLMGSFLGTVSAPVFAAAPTPGNANPANCAANCGENACADAGTRAYCISQCDPGQGEWQACAKHFGAAGAAPAAAPGSPAATPPPAAGAKMVYTTTQQTKNNSDSTITMSPTAKESDLPTKNMVVKIANAQKVLGGKNYYATVLQEPDTKACYYIAQKTQLKFSSGVPGPAVNDAVRGIFYINKSGRNKGKINIYNGFSNLSGVSALGCKARKFEHVKKDFVLHPSAGASSSMVGLAALWK